VRLLVNVLNNNKFSVGIDVGDSEQHNNN